MLDFDILLRVKKYLSKLELYDIVGIELQTGVNFMQTTLLTEEQIWGDQALDVMDSYGRKTGVTDLGVVLGALMSSGTTTIEGERSGYIWSASASGGNVRTVSYSGDKAFIIHLSEKTLSAPLCLHLRLLKSARAQRGR